MFECSGVKVRLWCGTGCDGAENLRFFIPFGRSFFFLYHSSSLGCMLSCFSCVQLFATLWIISHQASLSMGFSKKEYWNGLPFLLLGCLPDPGIKPASRIAGRFFYHWAIVEACCGSFHILFFLFICSHLNTVIGLWRYCYYLLLTTQHLEQCLKVKVKEQVTQSCPTLCDLMTIQSMEFSRPEYWSA